MASKKRENPYFTKYKWWEKPSVQYSFYLPKIRLRLERLMGTQVTNLTDRQFMLRYQERLLEDYADKMEKRCKDREFGELERLKNLVLNEIIPVSAAPKEMANHPIMLIDAKCSKLIAARRALIKVPKVTIPTFLYWDDTPDIETGLKIGTGHVFRKEGEKLCLGPETFQNYTEEDEATYSLPNEEYDKLVYEDPLVKELLNCNTVEQMYNLANKIIGALRVVDEAMQKFYEDTGSEQLQTSSEPMP